MEFEFDGDYCVLQRANGSKQVYLPLAVAIRVFLSYGMHICEMNKVDESLMGSLLDGRIAGETRSSEESAQQRLVSVLALRSLI